MYCLSLYYDINCVARNSLINLRRKYKINLSTKEILDLLNKEHINTNTSNNMLDLLNLGIREKEIILNNKLKKQLKSNIELFEREITEIKSSAIDIPDIKEEMTIDNKKIILDEEDEVRRNKNIKLLENMGIVIHEKNIILPFNATTKIRDKQEILAQAIKRYTLAFWAMYAYNGKEKDIDRTIDNLSENINMRNYLNPDDLEAIEEMKKKKVPKEYLNRIISWFEDAYILLWTLGFYDNVDLNETANFINTGDLLFKSGSFTSLINKSKLRSKSEILDITDLIFRLDYACRFEGLDKVNPIVIFRDAEELCWVTCFDVKKLYKSKINVVYTSNFFNFVFKINPIYKICDVTNKNSESLLFSLGDYYNNEFITFYNLGVRSGFKYLLYAYYKDCESYSVNKWRVITQDDIKTSNVGTVKKMIVCKDDLYVGIYYFIVNFNVVSLTVKLESDNFLESKNDLIALDLIKSIKQL